MTSQEFHAHCYLRWTVWRRQMLHGRHTREPVLQLAPSATHVNSLAGRACRKLLLHRARKDTLLSSHGRTLTYLQQLRSAQATHQ